MRDLTTGRLLLRNVRTEDMDDLYELVSDEQSCLDDGAYHAFTRKDDPAFVRSFFAIVQADEHYAAVIKGENKVIGLIHLTDSEDGRGKSVGYHINKAYRRRGFAKEAVLAVIESCFESCDAEYFFAECYEYNTASRRTLEALGFELTGIYHNRVFHPQRGWIDSLCFCRTRSSPPQYPQPPES